MEIEILRKELDSGKISAVELTRSLIDKIKKEDGNLNSFITLAEDEAISAAKKADERIKRGEQSYLTGIPITLKDNICTEKIRTTAASRMLEDFVPPYDATAVARLKSVGAVILGKTNMDEFAMGSNSDTSYFGRVKNPINPEKSAGGSSGGAAVSVKAEFCAAALGSDTGGSVRLPASYCGVCGIKPTYGRVSRFGLIAFASSLDQIGVIANSARDCAHMLNCISGYDESDRTTVKRDNDFLSGIGKSISGLTVALPEEFFSDKVSDDVKCAVFSGAKFLEKKGAKLKSVSMPSLDYAVSAYYLISSAEAASNLARFDGIKYGYRSKNGKTYEELIENTRREGFGEEVKRRILLGNFALSGGYYDEYYKNALKVRNKVKNDYERVFDTADIIISPTACKSAPDAKEKLSPSEIYMADICTVPVNIAGFPAISTTCGYSADGLPIGMSITGKSFFEQQIISVCDTFERGRGI